MKNLLFVIAFIALGFGCLLIPENALMIILRIALFLIFVLVIVGLVFYLKRNPSDIEHQGREFKYKYPKN